MTRFVTVPELKEYLRNEKPTDDDGFYENAIDTAEMVCDNACGRRFYLATTATARTIRPARCSTRLEIYDCTGVTTVAENGITVSASEYFLEPLNGLSYSGETVPYTDIRRKGGVKWYSYYDEATITVTATWGWASIPPQVVESVKIAAKAVIEGRDLSYGLVALADGGALSEREAKVVRQMVHDYRRAETIMVGGR